jgi:hypothetical protein
MVALTSIALGLVSVFLGFQLVSLVSIVASWLSLAAGVGIGFATVYYLFTDGYLDPFFDTEEIMVLSSSLIGAVTGFISYRLIEALLATAGLSIALIVAVVVLLSIVFTPGFVLGGIVTLIEFVFDLLDSLGGEN